MHATAIGTPCVVLQPFECDRIDVETKGIPSRKYPFKVTCVLVTIALLKGS